MVNYHKSKTEMYWDRTSIHLRGKENGVIKILAEKESGEKIVVKWAGEIQNFGKNYSPEKIVFKWASGSHNFGKRYSWEKINCIQMSRWNSKFWLNCYSKVNKWCLNELVFWRVCTNDMYKSSNIIIIIPTISMSELSYYNETWQYIVTL